jgi:ferredoxin
MAILGIPTRRVRITVQTSLFLLWATLIYCTHYPMQTWVAKNIPVSLFLRIDPLVATVIMGGMRVGVTILLLGLVTFGVSMLLGRVFCGWVCPLGATFDFYSYIIKKFGVRHHGPSPWWFRLKYYILAAILVFAVFGSVSPLIGIDPVVLITRVAAAVLQPFGRVDNGITWSIGERPHFMGLFIDFTTLALFLAIMAYTTRVSRIWCRAICPLGAYLASLSRHSVLRRQTDQCVHCNICSASCPTGAINFENAEFYNESECIKCFICSEECPVDANFFTLRNPLKANDQHGQVVELDRRAFLGTTVTALIAAPFMRIEAGVPGASKKLLRPPMSREESDFLSSCIRCGECMKACPTGTLKPAGLEHGLRSLWTPVMTPLEAPCKEGCNACSQACPTDAIMKYPVEKKYLFKAGTAVFNPSNCISYTEGKFCSECVRVCPVDAIEFKKGWEPNPTGPQHKWGVSGSGSEEIAPVGRTPTRPVHIKYDVCVGCGACETSCNQIVFGATAMTTTSQGRAVPTTNKPTKTL